VKPSRQLILYTVLRFGIFAIVLAVLLLLGIEPWIAAVTAAVIGFCVSYLLLWKQRNAAVDDIRDLRSRAARDADSDAENEAVDRARDTGSADRG
jgi:membrane protein implicated in regulation of membrane protease activity